MLTHLALSSLFESLSATSDQTRSEIDFPRQVCPPKPNNARRLSSTEYDGLCVRQRTRLSFSNLKPKHSAAVMDIRST